MLINFTNHPSKDWSEEQLAAAAVYGKVQDLPFPPVPEDWDENNLAALAVDCAEKIAALNPQAVVCQGEFTLTADGWVLPMLSEWEICLTCFILLSRKHSAARAAALQ